MLVLSSSAIAFALIPLAHIPADDDAQEVRLTLVSSGAYKTLGGYVPMGFWPTEQKPATLKKLPADLRSPRFATIPFAGPDKAKYHVILDEPPAGAGAMPRLYADANGDGDMTNDPPAQWKIDRPAADGRDPLYAGGATFDLAPGASGKSYPVHIEVYCFGTQQDKIAYYRDFATEGTMKLGEKSYRVMLSDDSCRADYSALPEEGDYTALPIQLLVDVNADGSFDTDEVFPTNKPFKIKGAVYELLDIAEDGLSFKIRKSDRKLDDAKTVPPKPRVILNPGDKALAFEAPSTDAKPIKFPGDYKGKLVLLDFWATWCAPCMKEVPHIVAAREKFASRGLEIVGISLDRAGAEEKMKSVAAKYKMTWPQIHDGSREADRVTDLYNVKSIPTAYLIDGDTGLILAASDSLRGEDLEKTIDAELKKKSR